MSVEMPRTFPSFVSVISVSPAWSVRRRFSSRCRSSSRRSRRSSSAARLSSASLPTWASLVASTTPARPDSLSGWPVRATTRMASAGFSAPPGGAAPAGEPRPARHQRGLAGRPGGCAPGGWGAGCASSPGRGLAPASPVPRSPQGRTAYPPAPPFLPRFFVLASRSPASSSSARGVAATTEAGTPLPMNSTARCSSAKRPGSFRSSGRSWRE